MTFVAIKAYQSGPSLDGFGLKTSDLNTFIRQSMKENQF